MQAMELLEVELSWPLLLLSTHRSIVSRRTALRSSRSVTLWHWCGPFSLSRLPLSIDSMWMVSLYICGSKVARAKDDRRSESLLHGSDVQLESVLLRDRGLSNQLYMFNFRWSWIPRMVVSEFSREELQCHSNIQWDDVQGWAYVQHHPF